MELKFLKEGTTTKEEDGVKIEFGQITSSVQALLITMATVVTVPGKTAMAAYIIKNILTKLTLDGKDQDLTRVANSADISDKTTMDVFFKISRLVMSEIVLGYDTKKKSGQQQSPSEKEGTASSAQILTEDNPDTGA